MALFTTPTEGVQSAVSFQTNLEQGRKRLAQWTTMNELRRWTLATLVGSTQWNRLISLLPVGAIVPGKVFHGRIDPVEFSRTEDLEDDVPYEERLKVGMRIQRGIEDVEAGRVYTVEQVRNISVTVRSLRQSITTG